MTDLAAGAPVSIMAAIIEIRRLQARIEELEKALIATQKPMGCVCPPTSEQTCQSAICPRKSYGIRLPGGML